MRPVRNLPRNAFMGGGIEVSFPISHTPSLLERVCCDVALEGGRAYVTVGERELRFGMQWSVEFSLAPGEAFLTQRARFACLRRRRSCRLIGGARYVDCH